MLEIEFSVIEDNAHDIQVLTGLLDEFQERFRVRVRLQVMTWEQAWPQLLAFALDGRGPDVSHIGSTWASSLVMMNALRPFAPADIQALGGPAAFLAPAWQGVVMPDDARIWGIPWTSYFYVALYWRELFARAALEPAALFSALASPSGVLGEASLLACARRMHASGVEYPWLMPISDAPSTDVLHIAANWVGQAGGALTTPTGRRTLFTHPDAMAGWKDFLMACCTMPASHRQMDGEACSQAFLSRRAALLVTDVRSALTLPDLGPVGMNALTGAPWYGGGTLVIWQHVQGYSDRQRAALALVNFLGGQDAQARYARLAGTIPARLDALQDTFPAGHPLAEVIALVHQHGRAHPCVSLWRRVEFQLAQALNDVRHELGASDLRRPVDLEMLLRRHLDPLAQRLDLTLNQ